MVFLPLHASVLEPDFDLSFAESERMSDLDATTTSEVTIEVELFLQLQNLMSSVGCP